MVNGAASDSSAIIFILVCSITPGEGSGFPPSVFYVGVCVRC